MSRIVLFLPGNLFHSNITQEKMKRLLDEKAGMKALCKSKIPIVFAWQMIDWLLAPDIYDPGPHELCAGSYSHALHSLLADEDSDWQTANGIEAGWKDDKGFNSIDVAFYPEFAPPADPRRIQTKYFFLLGPYTRYYDYNSTTGELSVCEEISNIQAISFGSDPPRIGIVIGNSGSPIRKKWHAYQRNPGKGLGPLVDETKRVADQDGRVHIALWDLETPYVGSDSNAEHLWLDYFEALKDTVKVFSPLEPHLEWFKERAVDASYIGTPHRRLDKWTLHDIQLDYKRRAYDNFKAEALSPTEHLNKEQRQLLLAIARSSDVLSVMDSRIRKQEEGLPSHMKKNRAEVLRLGIACLNILGGKDESLESLSRADPILGPLLVEKLQDLSDNKG